MLHAKGALGAPATSGTSPTGVLRVDTTSGNGNVMDVGLYSASPYGGWIQVYDRTTMAMKYPLVLNPTGGRVGIGIVYPGDALEVAGGGVRVGGRQTIDSSGRALYA